MIDLEAVRRDTPSCVRMAHLNNAGASPMPEPVKRAVIAHIERESEVGGYAAAADATADIEDFYDAFATLLHCDRSEIAYVENATRAWNMAFYAIDFRPGDRVITCTSEYASNYLALLHMAKAKGIHIDEAPNDETGQVSVSELEALIGPRTRLVAITHVPTQGGLINPAVEIGRVARRHGVPFLLDACQSAGQIPLDVEEIGCDFLSGTGRKFLRGPRGTGFLYVRHSALDGLHPPFVDLHSASWTARDSYALRPDARRFENWESHVAGRVGLARAVRYTLDLGIDAISARARGLAAELRSGLARIADVEVTDQGAEKCAIVTFRKRDEPAPAILQRLAANRITGSVSMQDYARLDFEARGLDALVRLSVHYFNAEEEIGRACAVVANQS